MAVCLHGIKSPQPEGESPNVGDHVCGKVISCREAATPTATSGPSAVAPCPLFQWGSVAARAKAPETLDAQVESTDHALSRQVLRRKRASLGSARRPASTLRREGDSIK
jgi:hypothetical protein